VRTTRVAWLLLLSVFAPPCIADAASGTNAPAAFTSTTTTTSTTASQLLDTAGRVEIARTTGVWTPARPGLDLPPGTQLRTSAGSRATLLLSDKSVIRISENTLVEIRAPVNPAASATRAFFLRFGALFFLNRERPAEIEFETPLSRGAIRGTEFLLETDPADGTTRLALFDGAVDLTAVDQTLALASGEAAEVLPGQPPRRIAALPATALIQWIIYYPAVLDPDELSWSDTDRARLGDSLTAYRSGDLLAADAALPGSSPAPSDTERVYRAAISLGLGRTTATEALPDFPARPRLTQLRLALLELVTAARGEYPRPAAPAAAEPTTASGWLARSYRAQLERNLPAARDAARKATVLSPEFGFAWARLAELEFSFGDRRAARAALDSAFHLAPKHAPALALAGFIALDENKPERALQEFQRAIATDGSLPTAWLGQGLAHAALRRFEDARRDLQVAAALEPHRGVFRSYLGKAFSETREDRLAEKDFRLAQILDPADPTAWLYSALHHHQLNRRNEAVRDLEKAVERNDNRAVFRSELLLDQDRALRSANLAALYDDVGLDEVAYRSATRAIADDYASFSSHLFLARLLSEREDPSRVDLRYETPRQSELLIANLLAPPGAGNLSQLLSQQDHLRYFQPRPLAASSFTEYRDNGSWSQAGSIFGQLDQLGYALDSHYLTTPGDRPNADFESLRFSLQLQQHLGPSDSVYLQVGWAEGESGDVARYLDPSAASTTLRTTSRQEPHLYAGYHHAWNPAHHSLLLAGHLRDHLNLRDSNYPILFVTQRGGTPTDVSTFPGYDLDLESDFTLNSVEAQHLFQSDQHALVAGVRFQDGSVDTSSQLASPLPSAPIRTEVDGALQRFDAYSYYHWKPIQQLMLTAGIGYHDLEFPQNADLPPLSAGQDRESLVAPTAVVLAQPWRGADLRAAYSRSLGGLYFDDSIRLEPTQVGGFVRAYRSLLPESVGGLVPGTVFDTLGTRLDQAVGHGTYVGIEALRLTSSGDRSVGALTHSLPVPVPDSPTQIVQALDFEERSLAVYANQLLGQGWSIGLRYHLSVAELDGQFPSLPGDAPGVSGLEQDERATLGVLELAARFYHPTGWFAEWHSEFFHQQSEGYSPEIADESLWQHHVFVGYRLPRRRAEVRLGLLNLTDEEPHLNPLNLTVAPPRERTFYLSLRLNF
jgi:tetratricopeptide (TPR) repeat protein